MTKDGRVAPGETFQEGGVTYIAVADKTGNCSGCCFYIIEDAECTAPARIQCCSLVRDDGVDVIYRRAE